MMGRSVGSLGDMKRDGIALPRADREEAAAFIGAAHYECPALEVAVRNGSRPETESSMAVGGVELQVPELRPASLFPRCSSGAVGSDYGRCDVSEHREPIDHGVDARSALMDRKTRSSICGDPDPNVDARGLRTPGERATLQVASFGHDARHVFATNRTGPT